MLSRLKQWSRALLRDATAVYLAARDPRVPWYAKALGIAVSAYAFSPIDLIPDFIPVIGYLDDLIIVPLGIALAVKLIPPEVMAEHRAAALQDRPVSTAGAIIIVMIWIAASAVAALAVYRYLLPRPSLG